MQSQISPLAAEILVAGKLRSAEPTLKQEDAEALARVHLTLLKKRGTPLPLDGAELNYIVNSGFILQTPTLRETTDSGIRHALRPTWAL